MGTYNANQAIVEADEANVKQLQALQSFEKIYAPFDGVVTARNTDIGDLINSGSSGGVKTDLFHIAQPGTLRVYVNVPEEYSQGVKVGMTANLALAEFPGRTFQGKLVRTADAINVTTRTLLIEIDVRQSHGHSAHGLLRGGPLAGPDAGLHVPASGQYSDIPLGRFTCRHRQRRESRARDRNPRPRFRAMRSRSSPASRRTIKSSSTRPTRLFPDSKSKLFRQHCREIPSETGAQTGFRQ